MLPAQSKTSTLYVAAVVWRAASNEAGCDLEPHASRVRGCADGWHMSWSQLGLEVVDHRVDQLAATLGVSAGTASLRLSSHAWRVAGCADAWRGGTRWSSEKQTAAA